MIAQRSSQPIAITGATLIDGLGGPPLADATIVVEDGRFSRVGPSAATPVPEGAEVVDAHGKFVIPGLVDMHVHAEALRTASICGGILNGDTVRPDSYSSRSGEYLLFSRNSVVNRGSVPANPLF